jgi:hypothetical protein
MVEPRDMLVPAPGSGTPPSMNRGAYDYDYRESAPGDWDRDANVNVTGFPVVQAHFNGRSDRALRAGAGTPILTLPPTWTRRTSLCFRLVSTARTARRHAGSGDVGRSDLDTL